MANRGDQLGSPGLHLLKTLNVYPPNREMDGGVNAMDGGVRGNGWGSECDERSDGEV